MTNNIFFLKSLFVFLVLFVGIGTDVVAQSSNGAKSDDGGEILKAKEIVKDSPRKVLPVSLKIASKVDTILIDHNGAKFLLYSKLEYPYNNPSVYNLLCTRLLGNSNDKLKSAFTVYLEKFDSYHKATDPTEFQNYKDGLLKIGTKFHGAYYNRCALKNIISEKYRKMADRYAPFYYYINRTDVSEEMNAVGIEEVKGMFTYDIETGRLLTITDVFTKEAIEDLNICGSADNEEVLIRPYDGKVTFWGMEGGKKIFKECSIVDDAELFTDRVKDFSIELKRRKKEIAEDLKKRIAESRQTQAKVKERARKDYQTQNTKMEDLYLYMWDDTCYVSGIHKDIMKMTDEEIDRLASCKGCEYIGADIRAAVALIKKYGSAGMMINEYGDANPEQMCDYAPIPPKPLNSVQGSTCKGARVGDVSKIRYVIDSDGNLCMPIIFMESFTDYIHKSAQLDKFYVSKIRKLGKWIPAMAYGKHVNVVYKSKMSINRVSSSAYKRQ